MDTFCHRGGTAGAGLLTFLYPRAMLQIRFELLDAIRKLFVRQAR
jgi:hypothetical protein